MHPDTLAALRLLALALQLHPNDAAALDQYGSLAAWLADAVDELLE
jgi:hypothetical protein